MLLSKGQLKYKHRHKGRVGGVVTNEGIQNYSNFYYMIRTAEAGLFTNNQLEVVRWSLRRLARKFSKAQRTRGLAVCFCVRVSSPRTKKKKAARMGCAKGPFFRFVAPVRAGSAIAVLGEGRKLPLRGFCYFRSLSRKLPTKSHLVLHRRCFSFH